MQVDEGFYVFLRKSEGYSLRAYPDSNNVPTIGIGHKLTRSEKASGKITIDGIRVRYDKGLTGTQVNTLCRQDTRIAVSAINGGVKVGLNQNQFNALVSFAFNVGSEAFRCSTLLKKLNQGLYNEVPAQLARWIYDDGDITDGLILRRNAEIALWNKKIIKPVDNKNRIV